MRSQRYLCTIALLGALSTPGWADLLGTQVTGKMIVPAFSSTLNLFDSANGFVPGGFLNSGGATTVTIANPAIEFGYDDGVNADSANFTGSTLTLKDISLGGSAAVNFAFVDAAFNGLILTKISDNFAGGVTGSLSGNQVTLSFGSFASTGTSQAVFSLAPAAAVPEPASGALLVSILAIAGFRLKRLMHRT